MSQSFHNLAFQYDANNRQKQSSAVNGSGAVVSLYDADGQRVATQVGGSLTNVLVYDASGKLVGESPESNGTQFVTSDQQASPRLITNASGAVVSRHDYAPFGEDLTSGVGMRLPAQGCSQPGAVRQKYAGMENDAAWEVEGEMMYMIFTVDNRLHDWAQYGFKGWKDVLEQDSNQFLGYKKGGNIQQLANNPALVEKARMAIQAINDYRAQPLRNVPGMVRFYYWKGIVQDNNNDGQWAIMKRGRATRMGNTDFMVSEKRY